MTAHVAGEALRAAVREGVPVSGQRKRKGGGGNPVGKGGGGASGQDREDRMWVCRGCCCGTRAQHPGVDHRALEQLARAGAQRAGLRYATTDCLGPCAQGNIVVVRREGRIRWYRRMNSEQATTELLEHLEHGDALPAAFDGHLMPGRDGWVPDP